jgi:AsmA protein
MKRRKFRLWWLIPLSIVLIPPLLWMLLLLIIPTDWARARIARAVSQSTGRTVRLESLRIGLLGGVRLTNLEIGAPGTAKDPWLKVADARLNVTLLQLLIGQAKPTDAQVDGITLRVLRRADGSLELADLIPTAPRASTAGVGSGEARCALGGLEIQIHQCRVLVIDEPTGTRLEFRDVEGNATWQNHRATIHELHGTLNGGTFDLSAQLDGSTVSPSYEGQLRARRVELCGGMNALGYLVPVVAGTSDRVEDKVDGRLDVNLYLRGQGLTCEAIRTSLIGHGTLSLDPIRLDGSRMLAGLAGLVELPVQGCVGSVKTDVEIKRGRISTENLTLNVAKVPIVLSGWTDFDGRLDYRLKSDGLTGKLPANARNFLSELAIEPNRLAAARIRGTLDEFSVTIDGVPLDPSGGVGADPSRRGEDRQRLRTLGKRLRDRMLR